MKPSATGTLFRPEQINGRSIMAFMKEEREIYRRKKKRSYADKTHAEGTRKSLCHWETKGSWRARIRYYSIKRQREFRDDEDDDEDGGRGGKGREERKKRTKWAVENGQKCTGVPLRPSPDGQKRVAETVDIGAGLQITIILQVLSATAIAMERRRRIYLANQQQSSSNNTTWPKKERTIMIPINNESDDPAPSSPSIKIAATSQYINLHIYVCNLHGRSPETMTTTDGGRREK